MPIGKPERANAPSCVRSRESRRDGAERHAPPAPAPKAGEDTAPVGAALPLDDCMACGELRPLRAINGNLICDDCEGKQA
jgi:hypothetical protein